MSKARVSLVVAVLLALTAGTSFAVLKVKNSGASMTGAAHGYLALLDDDQKKTSLMDYEAPERLGWHFIPKDYRKGLQIKHMNKKQRRAAHALLRSALSQVGYDKATKIMKLEAVLHELERAKPSGNIRDAERYYFTVFGTPSEKGKWGLSIEGHHLSLNFVVDGNQVESSTPAFFAANPTIVGKDFAGLGVKKGLRVLAKEETLAFELVNALSKEQLAKALIDDVAPREIRAAGEPQPPTDAAAGIAAAELSKKQNQTLQALIEEYALNMPADVAEQQLAEIKEAGRDKVHFAWAGARKEGIGHYYRIQGPTFLIEFVNTQPDAAGNPASHIHCVWRDPRGDFAVPIK